MFWIFSIDVYISANLSPDPKNIKAIPTEMHKVIKIEEFLNYLALWILREPISFPITVDITMLRAREAHEATNIMLENIP